MVHATLLGCRSTSYGHDRCKWWSGSGRISEIGGPSGSSPGSPGPGSTERALWSGAGGRVAGMVPQCNVGGRRQLRRGACSILYSSSVQVSRWALHSRPIFGSDLPNLSFSPFLCRVVRGWQRGSVLPLCDPVKKKENLPETCFSAFSLAVCKFWQFSCDVSGHSQLGVQPCLCAAGLAARCIPRLGDAGQIQVPGTRGEASWCSSSCPRLVISSM